MFRDAATAAVFDSKSWPRWHCLFDNESCERLPRPDPDPVQRMRCVRWRQHRCSP